MTNKKDERKRVDLFFNPETENDLIDYLDETPGANATIIKFLMRKAIEVEREGLSVNYERLEQIMRKAIREEGVQVGVKEVKAEQVNHGPFGMVAKNL